MPPHHIGFNLVWENVTLVSLESHIVHENYTDQVRFHHRYRYQKNGKTLALVDHILANIGPVYFR